MLCRLYLLYLSLGELVDFEKLVDLLVEAVKYTLHLRFALFEKGHFFSDKLCLVLNLLGDVCTHARIASHLGFE